MQAKDTVRMSNASTIHVMDELVTGQLSATLRLILHPVLQTTTRTAGTWTMWTTRDMTSDFSGLVKWLLQRE